MIQLRKQFKKYGETFTQLYKDDEIVIYATTFPSVEVFKYRVRKPNSTHPDYWEAYPSESDFGKLAWCCTSEKQFNRVLDSHFALTSEKRQICVDRYRNFASSISR